MSPFTGSIAAAKEAMFTGMTGATWVDAAVGLPIVAVIIILGVAWWDLRSKTVKPFLLYQRTKFNEGLMSRMPTLKQVYKPLLFLTNGHVETIFAAKFRRACDLQYQREIVHMPDGGIVALDWRCTPEGEAELDSDAAVLMLLPGLTGGSDDSYVRYAVKYAHSIGIRAVVFNSRGCGDTFLTTPQFYSGLFIEDLKHIVAHVQKLYPKSAMFATGWSLGANILVNYLGFVGDKTPFKGAAALCNPFNLTIGDANMRKGFNRVYDVNLANAMSRIMRRNRKVWNGSREFDIETACNASSIRAWDEAITQRSFGFPTVDAYYAAAGSYQRIPDVKVPLLVVQAEDDPIAPICATPKKALYENPNCILAVTSTGGHLGWCSGEGGYFGEPWTDRVIVEWLQAVQLSLVLHPEARSGQDDKGALIAAPSSSGAGKLDAIPSTPAQAAAMPQSVPQFFRDESPLAPSNNGTNGLGARGNGAKSLHVVQDELRREEESFASSTQLHEGVRARSKAAMSPQASSNLASSPFMSKTAGGNGPVTCRVTQQPLQPDQYTGGYPNLRTDTRNDEHPSAPAVDVVSGFEASVARNAGSSSVGSVVSTPQERPDVVDLERAMEAMHRRMSPARRVDTQCISTPSSRSTTRQFPAQPSPLGAAVRSEGSSRSPLSPRSLWWTES